MRGSGLGIMVWRSGLGMSVGGLVLGFRVWELVVGSSLLGVSNWELSPRSKKLEVNSWELAVGSQHSGVNAGAGAPDPVIPP